MVKITPGDFKVITICLLFLFYSSARAQIFVDGKQYNIKEIDVQELAALAGADTLPFTVKANPNKKRPKSVYLTEVLIKPYFDERAQAYAVNLILPKTIDDFGLRNCKTPDWLGITISASDDCDIWFEKVNADFLVQSEGIDTIGIYLINSSINNINIRNSKRLDVQVAESKIAHSLNIETCQSLTGSISKSDIPIVLLKDVKVEQVVEPDLYSGSHYVNRIFFQFDLWDCKIGDLTFNRTIFKTPPSDKSYQTSISGSEINNLSIRNSRFPNMNLMGTTLRKSFQMDSSQVSGWGVLTIDLPKNTNIPFSEIQGERLFLTNNDILLTNRTPVKAKQGGDSLWSKTYDKGTEFESTLTTKFYTTRVYQAKRPGDILNEKLYNELINSYQEFLRVYKERGDIKSANLCYIEMKQIEGRRLNALYDQSPSLERYFAWQLNRFLYWFCDYGTNPVKSLVYACYVIALFSLVYFLFPSETDNLSREKVYSFFNKSVEYFKTDKQLTQIHQEERQHEIDALEKFSKTVKESKGTVPPVVWYLGAPLYKLGITYNKVVIWALAKSDIVKGRWEDLSPGIKFRLGTIISLYFFGFLLAGLLMRTLNALALSLNAFVTLGYGEISAKGIARYLAVVQGVAGWFLLSIFSVSLISQILS